MPNNLLDKIKNNIPYVTGIFRKDRSSFLLNHKYLEETQ